MRLMSRVLERAKDDEAVLAVLLFGSYSRGDQTSRSDIDLCLVLFPGREDGAAQISVRMAYLEECTGRVSIHVFQQLPLYVRSRVLKEGQVLVCKDWDALYSIAIRTAQAFEDFKPTYRFYLDQVAHAGS